MALEIRFFLAHLAIFQCKAVTYESWQWNGNPGYRQLEGSTQITSKLENGVISCSEACQAVADCYGFNWNSATGDCEIVRLLSLTLPVADPSTTTNWAHYRNANFVKNPCNWPSCTNGSVCLTYPRIYWESPVVTGQQTFYTCSSNAFLVKKYQSGMKNCYFKQLQNKDFLWHDVSLYCNVALPYNVVLRDCNAHGCLGVMCTATACYMKTANQEQITTQSLVNLSPAAYFYANCY